MVGTACRSARYSPGWGWLGVGPDLAAEGVLDVVAEHVQVCRDATFEAGQRERLLREHDGLRDHGEETDGRGGIGVRNRDGYQ